MHGLDGLDGLDVANDSCGVGDDSCGVGDDSCGDRVARQARRVVNMEFVHEVLAVFLHCFDADVEFPCDLFVGVAFGNELQDFNFAVG